MRFYTIDFDNDTHFEDLVDSAEDGKLRCIVDEESGGIIAYVLDSQGTHRTAALVELLNNWRGR